jgi:hypothetical protein
MKCIFCGTKMKYKSTDKEGDHHICPSCGVKATHPTAHHHPKTKTDILAEAIIANEEQIQKTIEAGERCLKTMERIIKTPMSNRERLDQFDQLMQLYLSRKNPDSSMIPYKKEFMEEFMGKLIDTHLGNKIEEL